MIPIKYVIGDATKPQGEGPHIIAHVCNDLGRWGRGFVLSLRERYPLAETSYINWSQETSFELGAVQFVDVGNSVTIANMIGQHGIYPEGGVQPIRYDAITQALSALAGYAKKHDSIVHMPRIGCGLAGGKWSLIEPIITSELSLRDVSVYVYDFIGNGKNVITWQK